MRDSENDGNGSQTARKACVFILSGNRLLREALQRILKIQVGMTIAGSSEDARAGLEQIAMLHPDVVLIDGSTLQFDWATVLAQAHEASPASRVVMFGMQADTDEFFRAIRAKVTGYVLSEGTASDLVTAVRCAARGEAMCPPRLCLALFNYVSRHSSVPDPELRARHGLTRREQQLLPMISQGLTNKEIAARLVLSEQTVKNHIGRILRKMGAPDRYSAAQAAQVVSWNL
jgi:two-component system response regulator DevR